MQTAATSSSTTESLHLSWSSNNESTVFFVILHFSEIEDVPSTDYREFDMFVNGVPLYNSLVAQKLVSGSAAYTTTTLNKYNVSLEATSRSTLPPLLNALELYAIMPITGIPTRSGDGKFDRRYSLI